MSESKPDSRNEIPNVVELHSYPEKEAFLNAMEQFKQGYVTAGFSLAGTGYGVYGPGEEVAQYVRTLAMGSPISTISINAYDGTPGSRRLLGMAKMADEFVDLTPKDELP